jgi:RsiW-degrading membrane proteinase PrsW (M82 family)
MPGFDVFGYAFLSGVLPACLWLYFLLKEDSRCPEPRSLIIIAFIGGMVSVFPAIGLEMIAANHLSSGLPVVLAWAAIEEICKYGLAAILVLWRRAVNEPIDLVMYMLTVALGFAAFENTLFLFSPIAQGLIFGPNGVIVLGNLRFVGSTLLHVIASSTVGFFLALAYFRRRVVRSLFAMVGLILAIALHTTFNFFIIQGDSLHAITAFFLVWTAAVAFFALFEILKYFRYRHLPKNTC